MKINSQKHINKDKRLKDLLFPSEMLLLLFKSWILYTKILVAQLKLNILKVFHIDFLRGKKPIVFLSGTNYNLLADL